MRRPSAEMLASLRRTGAFGAFGLLCFVVALVLLFPYERAKERIAAQAGAALGMDVEIASAGPTLGLGIALKEIAVRTQPPAGGKPTRFFIDEARVRVSPLAMLLGGSKLTVAAEAFGGGIRIERTLDKTDGTLLLKLKGLDMSQVPGIKESINLPATGSLTFDLMASAPVGKLAEAVGELSFLCADCVLGDGKEPLKIPGNPLLAEGMLLPRLRLGDLTGKVAIDKGVAKLASVEAKSPDGELFVEGEITLRDPLAYSSFRLYIRFKLSDALLARSDKLKLLLQLADAAGKRPDGFYGLRLSGRFDHLDLPEWNKTSPFATTPPARPPGAPVRPGITTVKPGGPGRAASLEVAPESPPSAPTPSIAAVTPSPSASPPAVPPPPPAPPSPAPEEPARAEQTGRPMGTVPVAPAIQLGAESIHLGADTAKPPPEPKPPGDPKPAPAEEE